MTMTNASKDYFEQNADQWDNLRSGFFQEEVRQSAIAKAYLRPEMIVADIGSGTGFMAAGLAPLVQKVHVLDGSAAMLEIARQNLSDFSNIEYQQSDGQALDLPDESMDAVFANMYLHHAPDPLAAIQEMVRVLKPGGRLMITDMDTHEYTWLKEEMADEWMGFARDQIRAWYKAAELVNILVDATGESCCAECEIENITDPLEKYADISVFVATGSKRLSMRETVQSQYGAIAESGKSCCGSNPDHELVLTRNTCCGEDTTLNSGFVVDYTPGDRAVVPEEAEQISLGCGNPSAIANMKAGEIVLDIGSGGGMDAFLASKQVGNNGKVIGVDMTPAMLKRARNTAQRNGINNVEFREGTAEALPVEDASVDVVISNCVINLSEDKGQVFNEAARVLKIGGRLEVSDSVSNKAFPLQAKLNNNDWSACISGALPETEYTDLIRQAGFTDIKVLRSAMGTVVDDVSAYSVHVSAVRTDNAEPCTSACAI
ncbi:MAG: arsenite methyltransferase [Anaerolineaceae bacterium]|nr:arsenite methyltransferase [Anaerolineaceae bacterium]